MSLSQLLIPSTAQCGMARTRLPRMAAISSRNSCFTAGIAFIRPRVLATRPNRRSVAAQPVQANGFFGVGAPEAILVGVVALLVFGPKGLAEAAKGLGQTLRAFQPTIRELTQVSQELKSSLEAEIGLDEIRSEFTKPAVPQPKPAITAEASSSKEEVSLQALREQMAADVDSDIERKRAESAAMAWGGTPPASSSSSGLATGGGVGDARSAALASPSAKPLESMSIDEIEKELQRRKAAVAAAQVPQQLSAEE